MPSCHSSQRTVLTREISQWPPALLMCDGCGVTHVPQIFLIFCDPFIIHSQTVWVFMCIFVWVCECVCVCRVTPVRLSGGMEPVESISVVFCCLDTTLQSPFLQGYFKPLKKNHIDLWWICRVCVCASVLPCNTSYEEAKKLFDFCSYIFLLDIYSYS